VAEWIINKCSFVPDVYSYGFQVYMTMYWIDRVVLLYLRTCIVVYLFIRRFYVENFNVSNTTIMYMLNFVDTQLVSGFFATK